MRPPPLLLFWLALSPLGAIVPFLVLSIFGYCEGALGSGIHCYVPLVSGYLEGVAGFWEFSFIFLIGIVWSALALAVWVLLLVRLVLVIGAKVSTKVAGFHTKVKNEDSQINPLIYVAVALTFLVPVLKGPYAQMVLKVAPPPDYAIELLQNELVIYHTQPVLLIRPENHGGQPDEGESRPRVTAELVTDSGESITIYDDVLQSTDEWRRGSSYGEHIMPVNLPPPGRYTLCLTINAHQTIAERNYANNVYESPIEVLQGEEGAYYMWTYD